MERGTVGRKQVTLKELQEFLETHDVKEMKIFIDDSKGEKCIYTGTKDGKEGLSQSLLLRLFSWGKHKKQ